MAFQSNQVQPDELFFDEANLRPLIDLYAVGHNVLCKEIVLANAFSMTTLPSWFGDSWNSEYLAFQYWDSEVIPADVSSVIEANRQRLPKGFHLLFSYKSALCFIKSVFPDRVIDAFLFCKHPAMQADFFRLLYLYVHGGLYIDADVLLSHEFCNISINRGFMALSPMIRRLEANSDGSWLWYSIDDLRQGKCNENVVCYFQNDVIASPPRNEFLRVAIVRATILIERYMANGDPVKIHWATGPTNLSAAVVITRFLNPQPENGTPQIRVFDRKEVVTIKRLDYKFDARNWKNPTDEEMKMPENTMPVSNTVEPFRRHYEDDTSGWGKNSGPGSNPYYTIEYRAFLDKFMRMNNVRSVVDIGCGDWQFSKYVNFSGIKYDGYDIVESIINRNLAQHARTGVDFHVMPAKLDEVIGADLLIIKDVLQHLETPQILVFLDKVFPKYKYCLVTNSFRKQGSAVNTTIDNGRFRCIDLSISPFSIKGAYVFEYATPVWEFIRTFLITSEIRP